MLDDLSDLILYFPGPERCLERLASGKKEGHFHQFENSIDEG
jgi:hypothetical protein